MYMNWLGTIKKLERYRWSFMGGNLMFHIDSRLKTKSHFPTACSVVEEIEASN